MLRVDAVRRRVRRQVLVDQRLVRHPHRLERVRHVERVVAHHRRQQHAFGNAEELNDGVERLLRALAVELDPAGVALRQAVGLVGPEGPRRSHRAVDVRHHDRGARAARVVQQLVHQQQPLRGGGGEHAHPGERGRDAGRHDRMLRLGGDDLGVELARGLELAQLLQDRRLRRDRVARRDLGARQARGPGHRVVAGQQHRVVACVAHRSSSTISIEPVGHSRTQMPQPLQ